MQKTFIDKANAGLGLSFLSYEGGDREFSKQQLDEILKCYAPWIGVFKTVWGPSYHKNNRSVMQFLKREPKVDAMTFVVQAQDDPDDYYIVIRGTNPRNLSEWIFQDFWVGTAIHWYEVPFEGLTPPAPPQPDLPAISFGVNIAMTILINHLKDPDSGAGIFQFFQARAEHKTRIYITGHSLGGSLAPAFAIYLSQNWPLGMPKPEIFVHAYAGPTVGNCQFATLAEMLGGRCIRYANRLDVATHVWNRASMESLPLLYSDQGISMSRLLSKVLHDIAIPAIWDMDYTQFEEEQIIPSKIVPVFNSYVSQMAYQHLIPYIADFVRKSPGTEQEKLLDLIQSWEILTSFQKAKPLLHFKNNQLRDYLEMLNQN